MKERLLNLLAAVMLIVTVLQPVLPAVAAGMTTLAQPATQRQAQWAMDALPDADCQNGGQCSG